MFRSSAKPMYQYLREFPVWITYCHNPYGICVPHDQAASDRVMELTLQLLRAEDPHVAETVAEHLRIAVERYVDAVRSVNGIHRSHRVSASLPAAQSS
jgi:hypothetical protein